MAQCEWRAVARLFLCRNYSQDLVANSNEPCAIDGTRICILTILELSLDARPPPGSKIIKESDYQPNNEGES